MDPNRASGRRWIWRFSAKILQGRIYNPTISKWAPRYELLQGLPQLCSGASPSDPPCLGQPASMALEGRAISDQPKIILTDTFTSARGPYMLKTPIGMTKVVLGLHGGPLLCLPNSAFASCLP